jgi:hypothetical protein
MLNAATEAASLDGCAPDDSRSKRTRELLKHKGLPEARLQGLWAGYGTLGRCDGCGLVVGTDDVEYELDFRQESRCVTIKFHRDCWETFRQESLLFE